MARQQYAGGLAAIAGLALASACNDADSLSAPRDAGLRSKKMPPVIGTISPTGPGPLLSGMAANVCADVLQASREVGTSVVAYACTGGANQQFALHASGEISAYGGTMCLDVSGGEARDGDPVLVWSCHGGANQKWTRTPAGELRTAVNGKCLDLTSASTANGTKLIVWGCHGGANQKWKVRDAAAGSTPVMPSAPATPTAPDTTTTTGAAAAPAELPRATVDVSMPASTGRTIHVAAGDDLQAALNAAQPGDVVTLAPGATFTGNYVLPAKAGSTAAGGGWIVVRPAAGLTLPAAGTRLRPSALNAPMPRIVTQTVEPALRTAAGAAGWRLVGIEVTVAPTQTLNYGLLLLGTGDETSTDQLPARVVLDRMYVHGHGQLHLKRCITLNSRTTAVVDSYVSECHGKGQETQGILGYNGSGPFRIENNYIEASGIGVLFGGTDSRIQGLVPSDIEVRRNHFFKPLAWRGVWTVKNALECKTCSRLLAEGNVFENNWVDGQNGFILLFQGLTDDNTAPWARITDLTIRNNVIRNAPGGVSLLSRVSYPNGTNSGVMPTTPGQRIVVENNVFDRIGAEGSGRLIQLAGDLRDVTIANNTGTTTRQALMLIPSNQIPAPAERLVVRDNVLARGQYGFFTDGLGEGQAGILKYAPGALVRGNVIYGNVDGPAPGHLYPTGNTFPASPTADGLAPASLGGFGMIEAGAVSGAMTASSTNGRAPGASFTAVAQATAGVVTP